MLNWQPVDKQVFIPSMDHTDGEQWGLGDVCGLFPSRDICLAQGLDGRGNFGQQPLQ